MLKNIHVFETRPVNYLKPYLEKAKSLGFNVILSADPHIDRNKLYKEFLSVYKHYSINPPGFEIACFARYFAIAPILTDDEPFLMTDTDVYITKAFKHLQGYNLKDTFIGSEGFNMNGSEGQISPHCTFWNRALINDFINFILETYRKNHEDDFLADYYLSQTGRLTSTGISDMNLLYLWKEQRNICYVNSNNTAFEYGIDHNLSSVTCEDDEFKSFAGRKYLKVRGDRITCSLKSGRKMDMALLHFQGSYKPVLKRFYLKRYAKFIHFTLRNNFRQHGRVFGKIKLTT